MAKKKEKTLEEKLQEALVPENQWPYILPENWCWTRLDFIANYKKGPFGSSLTKAMFVPKGKNTYKVYEQGNAINKSTQYGSYYITKEKYDSMDGFSVEPNDIIVSCAGTIGEIFRLPQNIEKGIINQALMRVRLNSSVVYQIFEYYFSKILIQNITDESNGTAIKNIPPFKVLKQMPFPLPPLPEQKRIVHRIESLFAKLDEAKEKIQQVLDGAEMRKAAILHKAFTGELTQNWRKENGISEDSWVQRVFGEFCDTQYGYTDSSTFEPVGPKFLRITDIKDNNVNWDEVPYCQINADDLKKYKLHSGDIVVARTGATTGKSFLLQFVPEAVFASYLIAIKINDIEKVIPQYVYWFMQSPDYWLQITVLKKGSAQPGVNAKKIKEINIKIPSPSEQTKIVEIVKSAWLKESKVVIEANTVIDNIEKIKKSILAKAFRGELGTNNPTEDSAFNLLKEVLQDKS